MKPTAMVIAEGYLAGEFAGQAFAGLKPGMFRSIRA